MRISDRKCTIYQLLTLKLILEGEGSWEYARPVFPCFIDLEGAYNRVLGGIYGTIFSISGPDKSLMRDIRLLYKD